VWDVFCGEGSGEYNRSPAGCLASSEGARASQVPEAEMNYPTRTPEQIKQAVSSLRDDSVRRRIALHMAAAAEAESEKAKACLEKDVECDCDKDEQESVCAMSSLL